MRVELHVTNTNNLYRNCTQSTKPKGRRMDIKEYEGRNKDAWNQVMPIHQQHRKTDLQEAVQAKSFLYLMILKKPFLIGFPSSRKELLNCVVTTAES